MQFLPIFLQILSGLFTSGACQQLIPTSSEPNPTPLTEQQTVAAHYDADSQSYDDHYVHSLRFSARQAEDQAGERRSKRRDLDAKIIAGLEKVRLATDDQVKAFAANPTAVPA